MTKKQNVVLNKDGYRTSWTFGRRQHELHVDVFQGDQLILEWVFDLVPNLSAQASVYLDQAILQAKANQEPS